MKKQRHSRKGGFSKTLTKDANGFILIYVDVAREETKTIGEYSSLTDAKQALEQQPINTGVYHILSHTDNRVVYSTKGESLDAE